VAVQRKGLIIAEAVGDFDKAVEVLARFGFKQVDQAPSLNAATARLRNDHYDLVIVPIDKLSGVEMALLEREIRREAAMLIGTAPKPDPDLILRGMRAGVQEFLVSPPSPTDLAAALDRLVRRSSTETQRGLVTAVFSGKGGLGTSSVALNLAYAFAKNHPDRRVALADFVIGSSDVRVMLDLKPAYDIGDLVMKVDRVDEELLSAVLTATPGGVWILPASEKEEVADMLDAAASASILNHLRAHFNVVIDCEHHMSDRTLAAFDAADRIVFVTQLTVPALRSTKRTLELCERLGYPDTKLFVLVNRFHSGDVVTLNDAKDVLGREVFWKIPNDYRAFADALTRGRPVTDLDAASPLAKAFMQLAAKLGGTSESEGSSNGATAVTAPGSRIGRILRIRRKN
jgi:pilus assembly protein CpaE